MNRCLESPKIREKKRISREIDREIRKSKQSFLNEKKLLLLGTGESGKSTFIKQMRIIHGEGFSVEEKMSFIYSILQNTMNGIKAMIAAMDKLGLEYEKPENKKTAEIIKQIEDDAFLNLEENIWNAIKSLWNDPGIQKCYSRRNEYQLVDSCKYYLNDIDRISKPEYVPTEQDILQNRIQTTGVLEYLFNLKKLSIRIVDVGGQRSERRKWLHCFDTVTSVIFFVAISEYDQVLHESQSDNRLEEALQLFKVIVDYPLFKDVSFILFLNKKDLLEEKIQYSHMVDYFPDFNGPKQNYEAAKAFILDKFDTISKRADKLLYSHFTCATDTKNVELIFSSVQDTIFEMNIKGLPLN